MKCRSHINYDDLLRLYKYISQDYSLNKTCELLDCNRSTIYRIIHDHLTKHPYLLNKYCYMHRDCINYGTCYKEGKRYCFNSCSNYVKRICPKLKSFPYICDFCINIDKCTFEKRHFNPEKCYIERAKLNRESKMQPKITTKSLKMFNEFITPQVKDKKSVEVIYQMHKDKFPVSTRTVRNWIDRCYLDIRRVDLINAQKREYKKEYSYSRPSNDPLRKVNRTYSCYLEYINNTGNYNRFEFDTVHGKKGDNKCIFTLYYPKYKFQIGYLLSECSSDKVIKALRDIREKIGSSLFNHLFKVILSDNGVEFDKLYLVENDPETNEKVINVFYTRPYRSGDKGGCEKNHELFRYFYQKGITLENLTQDELDDIFSNINSYPRKILNYKTPYELMEREIGSEALKKLGILNIPFDNLALKRK